jgi:hypothetical protein
LHRAVLKSGAIVRAKIGILHSLALESISAHVAPGTSPERAAVRMQNSNAEAPTGRRRRNSCMKPDISLWGGAARRPRRQAGFSPERNPFAFAASNGRDSTPRPFRGLWRLLPQMLQRPHHVIRDSSDVDASLASSRARASVTRPFAPEPRAIPAGLPFHR